MSRSLMTGITGLRMHQQKLDVVANNLANMNTTGYKAQATRFSDLVYNSIRGGASGTLESGGINPQSIGTGVQLAQITRQFSQGSLQATGEDFDFAIQGDGFFAVSGPNGDPMFTRAGSFALNADGRLIDPATGHFVQRIGVTGEGLDGTTQFQTPGDNSIYVPLGAAIAGSPTTNMEISGNLPATTRPPAIEIIKSSGAFFDDTGAVADSTTLLSDLSINQADYAAGDTIEINGTNPDGTPYSATLAADTATLGDLVNELNNSLTGATATLDPDGVLTIAADSPGEGFMSLIMTDTPGNTGNTSFAINSMFVDTDGYAGDVLELSIEIYDQRGESHRVSLEFSKVSANSWDVTATLNPNTGVFIDNSVMNLSFNEDGTYALAGTSGVGDGDIEIDFTSLQTPQNVKLDFSQLSHLASEYTAFQTQDGFPPGSLVSVAASPTGQLDGLASNGRTLPLAQLAVASFSNVSALEPVGGNYFRESISSGPATIGAGPADGRGQVVSGQLESSNVDIAQEFTQLIVAQRGFSANARTITVSDEMLEELTNIVR